MHGLINRSFEGFVKSAYGLDLWRDAMRELDEGFVGFEAMFQYDDALTDRLVSICAALLVKPRDVLLEDFGTYLVAHRASQRVRRLLRFGGTDYEDFLQSLEDLPGRAQLAVPDIGLPDMELTDLGSSTFRLECRHNFDGAGHVVVGLLRALADDYGALVLLEHLGAARGRDLISIHLLQADYTRGRDFDLADMSLKQERRAKAS